MQSYLGESPADRSRPLVGVPEATTPDRIRFFGRPFTLIGPVPGIDAPSSTSSLILESRPWADNGRSLPIPAIDHGPRPAGWESQWSQPGRAQLLDQHTGPRHGSGTRRLRGRTDDAGRVAGTGRSGMEESSPLRCPARVPAAMGPIRAAVMSLNALERSQERARPETRDTAGTCQIGGSYDVRLADQFLDGLAAVDDLHRATARGGVLSGDVNSHRFWSWWRSSPSR